MSKGRFILLLLLAVAVLLTSVSVVYAKYASRKDFVELQAVRAQIDSINVQWGRLQLEQSTWATHGRVEKIARKKLKMRLPMADEVVVVKP